MATDVMPNTEPSMTKLVGGIIDDTQRLLKQQVDLVKADISREIKDAKEAAASMALAGALMSVGGLVLAFMLVHLLTWAFEPRLPHWVSHAVVGGLFAAAGGIAFYLGRAKLDKLTPPGEQTVEGLKENLQWKTNPN